MHYQELILNFKKGMILKDVVIDYSNGKKITMRKELYYIIAQIEEKDVTRQNHDEVLKLMLKHGVYGGWIR